MRGIDGMAHWVVTVPQPARSWAAQRLAAYVVEGHLLTITYGDGKPFHGRSGEKITLRLQAGDDPTVIAKRLPMQI